MDISYAGVFNRKSNKHQIQITLQPSWLQSWKIMTFRHLLIQRNISPPENHHRIVCYCILYLIGVQLVLGFGRDGLKTFWVETETKTETWAPETETRPRRLPNCPRRDRDETLECPRRDRDETFFWSRLSRHMAYKCMVYMHFTLCPKKRIP